mgnify:CR=1 FL=1
MQMMNKNGFNRCAEFYIGRLRKEGRYSTAHVYKNALFSFSKFCGTSNVSFRQITRERLRRYGQYLYECGLKPNTISTYMRMLRSIYNRGVEAGSAPYVPRLFHDVYTGVDVRQKKALPATELYKLLYEDPKSERLRRTQAIAALMFQFCGMAFVDFAHLKKENVRGGVLEYKRQKTGTPMLIEVQSTAWESLRELSSDVGKDSPYLFPFLKGIKVGKEAYKEYTSALAHFNRNLKRLARACGVSIPITSYSIRHSFAMILKEQDVPIEMISELLGHKSIKTTQIYLKSFSLEKMSAVNKICFESVYNHVPKVG